VGAPNGGKSALVAHLTAAKPEVADYPMTTREATPGMMAWGDIAFQLMDLPPLNDEYVENWITCRLAAEDRLAEPWTAETAADMLLALMRDEFIDTLAVDRDWLEDQHVALLATLFRRTFVDRGAVGSLRRRHDGDPSPAS